MRIRMRWPSASLDEELATVVRTFCRCTGRGLPEAPAAPCSPTGRAVPLPLRAGEQLLQASRGPALLTGDSGEEGVGKVWAACSGTRTSNTAESGEQSWRQAVSTA